MAIGHTTGLNGVIITGELERRPSRAPDYENENRALAALAEVMSSTPTQVLQDLVEAVIQLTRADSAGVSLLEPGRAPDGICWAAVAGAWAPHVGGTMRLEENPCGEVMARGAVALVRHPERAFPALLQAQPGIGEGLLAPFFIDGAAVGTLWVVKHDAAGHFDAEHARLLLNLAMFAAVAQRMVLVLDHAETCRREDQARADAALRQSEQRFRAFVVASADAVYRMSADWSEMQQLEGQAFLLDTREPSETWLDRYIHPEDQTDVRAAIARAIATKSTFELEHRVIRADGSLGWTRSRAVPILTAAGDISEWLGAASDITAARDAAAARADSEARFRQFAEVSSDVIWVRNADNLQFEYVSPVFEEIYGANLDTLLPGDNLAGWAAFIHPEDRERAVRNLERVKAGERVTHEFRVRHGRSGEIRWVRDTDFPLTDEYGRVRAVAGIGQDVTERHRAAEALRESEARLQGLVDGIPQLVWRSNDRGRWTWASPQWLDFTGQTQHESHGLGWLDAVHPDDRERTRTAWDEACARGMLDVEFRVRSARNGKWLWHHTRSVPVRNEPGHIVEWLGTSTDVQVLKELQERQGVLVAELQHRTRNLMAVVRSVSDKTARSSGDLPDFRARFRDRLDALARVQGLLSRLGDMNRVTFDELIESELTAMDGDTGKVTLAGPPGIRLRSSTVQTLAMALHELATNAIKYGALGQSSGKLAVNWSLQRADDDGAPWLHIEWRESGVVMPSPSAPARGTGHGRELIERALPYQLGAETHYDLGPEGVHCTILLPVSATAAGEGGRD